MVKTCQKTGTVAG